MSKKFDEAVYKFCEDMFILFRNDHDYLNIDELDDDLVFMKKILSKSKAFVPPTPEDVQDYARTGDNPFTIDGIKFCNFYEAKGWMIGKSKMKSWKACVRTWAPDKKRIDPEYYEQKRRYDEVLAAGNATREEYDEVMATLNKQYGVAV